MLRHLPFFIAVAEEENFQRAAARLKIAQPALTRRIQELERKLGTRLFDRLPRGVRLNEAGRVLLDDGKRVLEEFDRACQRAARAGAGEIGRLRLGYNDVALKFPVVAGALRDFRARYPDVELRLMPMPSEAQRAGLRGGSIDAGLFYMEPAEVAGLAGFTLAEDDFLLALPRFHRLAARNDLCLADLAEERFLWPSRTEGRVLYDRMIAACRERGFSPNIEMEILTADNTLSVVASGIAVGFVPVSRLGAEPDGVVLRKVADFSVPMRLDLAWAENGPDGAAPPVVERLAALLKPLLSARN